MIHIIKNIEIYYTKNLIALIFHVYFYIFNKILFKKINLILYDNFPLEYRNQIVSNFINFSILYSISMKYVIIMGLNFKDFMFYYYLISYSIHLILLHKGYK